MSLFQSLARIFNIISVKENRNLVTISGLDGTVMARHIKRVFQTNVVNKHMFTTMTPNGFSINSFFVPDLIYLLQQLKEDHSVRWLSKTSIENLIDKLIENTWYKQTVGEIVPIVDIKRLKLLKVKPLPKQREFIDIYGDKIPRYGINGYILAAGPGTGKTIADLLISTCVVPPSVAEVKIILTPKKAMHLVWEKTVKSVFVKTPTVWCSDSGVPAPDKGVEYYLFNYEKLKDAIALAKQLKARNVRYFVTVDESHNFADYKSMRTEHLVELQTLSPNTYFLWLSGSPVIKDGAELSTYLRCADPLRFDDDAEKRFRKIYQGSPGRANEIFNHRLGRMMAFVVPKSEVMKAKPVVVEQKVKLPTALAKKFLMSSVQAEMREYIKERLEFYRPQMASFHRIVENGLKIHEAQLTTPYEHRVFNTYRKNLKILSRNPDMAMNDLLREAKKYERRKLLPTIPIEQRKVFRSSLSAIKNIKLKVRGEALGKILAKRRAECAQALAVYCNPEQIMANSLSKTIFFSSAIMPIKSLAQHLEETGYHPVTVYGQTNTQLVPMMEAFAHNPQINPVCATFASLSEAVPVTAASTVVMLNRPFRQSSWDQSVSRAARLGQPHLVTVIEVTLDTGNEPNVSSTTDAILVNIRQTIEELLGDEFGGPDPSEREVAMIVDASQLELEIEEM